MEIAGFEVTKAEALIEPSSILLYGRPKVGKSYCAASISEVPGYERVLHIDLERGSVAFASRYPNVDVLHVPYLDVGAFTDIINALQDEEVASQYDAVIVDTMSTAQDWYLEALSDQFANARTRFEAWRLVGEWTMQIMWQLHHMKPLGISLYHLQVRETELTKEVWTLPKIKSSAAHSIAAVPDIIGQLYIVDGNQGPERVANFAPRESQAGGNRFDHLPDQPLADIDLPLLWQYIRHERTDVAEAPRTAAERYDPDGEDADE